MNKPLLPAALAALALAGTAFAAPAAEEAEPKIPTPDTPILMIGDSMMRLLGHEMEKAFKKADIQPAVAFSSLGSGLVRPSAFDWTAKIEELIATNHPKTVFVALGTNDRQAIEMNGGSVVKYEDADLWRATYSKCIGGVMDQLIKGGVTRVVWMLLPAMQKPVDQEHCQLVNAIVREQAADETRKDFVTLLDLGTILAPPKNPGKFTRYIMSPNMESLTVRDPDGVHLTRDGGKLVAQAVLKKYWNKK